MTRRWFQIHLSSIIFVTLFAGALLGFNMTDRDIKSQYQAWYANKYEKLVTWGWPMELGEAGKITDAKIISESSALPPKFLQFYEDSFVRNLDGSISFRNRIENYEKWVMVNIAACLGICFGVVVICEFVIRTLTRRRAVSSQQPTANSQQPP